MATLNLNWSKIQTEVTRLSNVNELKKELKRLTAEIRKFDIYAHLSPQASSRLKKLEKRAFHVSQTIFKLEKQLEREFNKVLHQLKFQKRHAKRTVQAVKKKKTAAQRVAKRRSSH